MSRLVQALTSAVRASSDPSIRTVSGHLLHEDDSRLGQSQPMKLSARVAEGSLGVDPVSVGYPETGMFTHFMDGMQRVHTPLTVAYVPLVYGYVGAVVRSRGADRKMRTHSHDYSEAIYCPEKYVNVEWLRDNGISIVDTSDEVKDGNDNLLAFLNNAHHKVGRQREIMESRLVSDWLRAYQKADNWLLVDGSLSGDYDHYESPNIVGVIKSHQTQYFSIEEQQKIVGMQVGCRSRVFIPLGRNRPEVYSWYLRMRPNEGRDAYFGLVRVEAAACDQTMKIVDDISRRLLAERTPLSLPDFRWDKLIYPIHDCEVFLRSRAPSWAMLESMLPGR